MSRNNLKIYFVLLVCLLFLGGCVSGPELRVGIAPNYPPLAFMQKGVLAGVEPDLAQQLGKQTGRKIVYDIEPFERLIPALEAGKLDVVMAGMSITPERQAVVSFTEPYLRVGQMLLVREKDIQRFPKVLFDQAAGVRVGVERGSTGEQYAVKTFAWGGISHFDTTEAGVRALEQGAIDCFIHDAPTIWRFSADLATQRQGLVGLFEPLTDEPIAWAVRKNDPVLREQLNTELARMRREGTLQAILGKWISTRVQVGLPGKTE